jgi:hypothetical protein
MLNNSARSNPGYSGIATNGGYALISSYTGSNNGREMGRMIALSLGAPVQFLSSSNRLSSHTFAAMLYMYEVEYLGRDGQASVWGQEYTDVARRERVPKYMNDDVSSTDVLCLAFNALRSNDSNEGYFIFNRLIQKFTNINADEFGGYMTYLIKNDGVRVPAFIRFLKECDSGSLIKAVMDAINEEKTNSRIRAALTRLRDSEEFAAVSQQVTSKILAASQNHQ